MYAPKVASTTPKVVTIVWRRTHKMLDVPRAAYARSARPIEAMRRRFAYDRSVGPWWLRDLTLLMLDDEVSLLKRVIPLVA